MTSKYLLFVDTETTGLPARWHRPYSEEWEWPRVVQVAWQVYTEAGELVKAFEAYLPISAAELPAQSVAIHGLTADFLAAHGQEPIQVLNTFLADLRRYQPRVIGHFLRLDFHVLGAALRRAALPNPLPALPQFCTMQLSAAPGLHPGGRPLRLGELHELLFREPMARLHDARLDAEATARCFFELRRRQLIPDAVLNGQPLLTEPTDTTPRFSLWPWVLGLVGALVLLYLFWHG
ncbi:3'-5' exonuclease [Hymenobacter pini]|uniref:3'-5' exonuclease n=1 Tax=Hymenobacter pini TaxID=2880879 RepID=UPI001CF34BFE|nr:3'-5' exonuclease [Hymenobacter pini]MCA8830972.1 3'-5' exonuclease [Hymenobacter pini]